MLRWLYSVATLSFALTSLGTRVAFSHPLSPSSQSPKLQNAPVDVPFCYMQTIDGRTLDLQKLCSQTFPDNVNRSSSNSGSEFQQDSGQRYRIRLRDH